jgi:hypothetical protein
LANQGLFSFPGWLLKGDILKKFFILLVSLVLTTCSHNTAEKEIEIQGRYLTSRKPPFALTLPSEFELIHHISLDYPKENSRTRTCLYIKKKEDRAEEILIVQIADRTNPESEPITTPPLKPQTEKRMYLNGQEKKEKIEVNYLIQSMVWNPDASSLQPIREKGITIPSHWALQGQILFVYQGEHAVSLRYSKDANAFGFKVSEAGSDWGKGSISGNEKKVYEIFQKTFLEIIGSIRIKSP